MFYDRFVEMCAQKGVKPTNACVEAGLSRGLAAKWKSTQTSRPSADALEKLSVYFGLSIEEILGIEKEKTATNGDDLSAEELKFVKLFSEADEQKRAAIKILLGLRGE